jgi:hypothetical protein
MSELASMLAGLDHVAPLYLSQPPTLSTATQNDDETHETDVKLTAVSRFAVGFAALVCCRRGSEVCSLPSDAAARADRWARGQ